MPDPIGSLTAAQHEIMEAVWRLGDRGASVAEIWQAVAPNHEVARTTILNQVDRLAKRNWLQRHQSDGGLRFRPTVTREAAAALLASEFVDDFFGGSASALVTSLLGSQRLRQSDIDRLRELLESADDSDADPKNSDASAEGERI